MSPPSSLSWPARIQVAERIHSLLSTESSSSSLSSSTRENLNDSLKLLRQSIEMYGKGLALSFNGGKDCTLLLYLLFAALEEAELPKGQENPIPTVYITHTHPFKEVDTFIDQCITQYGLDLYRAKEPMKEGLSQFLAASSTPIRAILVGIRMGDPYSSNLKAIQPTDPGWPSFIRIHPVLQWTHAEVWEVLRSLHLPYCPLYDQGYTSLGGTNDTRPNPSLLLPSSKEEGKELPVRYAPAWKLTDPTKERDCRVKR